MSASCVFVILRFVIIYSGYKVAVPVFLKSGTKRFNKINKHSTRRTDRASIPIRPGAAERTRDREGSTSAAVAEVVGDYALVRVCRLCRGAWRYSC